MLYTLISVVISAASLLVKGSQACWGGGTTMGPLGNHTDYNKIMKINKALINQTLLSAWGGFTVPQNVTDSWLHWLIKYEKDEMKKAMNGNSSYLDEAGNLPDSWKGAGAGHEGFPPLEVPPWGYKAKNTGLPAFCYQVPDAGLCIDISKEISSKRWAYNPYIEECQEFTYVGCGGNRNNFVEQLQCVEACMASDHTAGGCDLETDFELASGQNLNEEVPPEFQGRRAAECTLKQPTI